MLIQLFVVMLVREWVLAKVAGQVVGQRVLLVTVSSWS
jgi:hypothetical protein